jgi:hypothetical protein
MRAGGAADAGRCKAAAEGRERDGASAARRRVVAIRRPCLLARYAGLRIAYRLLGKPVRHRIRAARPLLDDALAAGGDEPGGAF